jgi:hypothetical protein
MNIMNRVRGRVDALREGHYRRALHPLPLLRYLHPPRIFHYCGKPQLRAGLWTAMVDRYDVPDRQFNAIFVFEDMQGDAWIRFVAIMRERGYKLEVAIPNLYRFKRGPHLDLRWAQRN